MHSAFAWLMIGIVTGMAMTVLYVANISVSSLQTVEAAGNKIVVTGPVAAGSRLLSTWLYESGGVISDDLQRGKIISTAGTYTLPTPSMTTNGQYFGVAGDDLPSGKASGALLLSTPAGAPGFLYLSKGSTIDTNGAYLNLNKAYTHTFTAYYVKKNGTKVPVAFAGSFLPITDIENIPTSWGSYNRARTTDGKNSIQVPGGIPYYVSPQLGIHFTNVPESGDQEANRKFNIYRALTFPSQPHNGTWELNIRQKVYGHPESGYTLISKTFIPDPNRSPKLDPLSDQSVIGGQALTFTVKATDADDDAVVYIPSNFPSGARLAGVSGVFTWTPPTTSVAYDKTITVRVFDNRGGSDSKDIKITVLPTPIAPPVDTGSSTNTPPVSGPATESSDITFSTGSAYSGVSNHARRPNDDVMFTINTKPNASPVVKKIVITLSGSAIATGTQPFTVQLINGGDGQPFGFDYAEHICSPVNSSCQVTFNPTYTLSAGVQTPLKLRLNSTNFANSASTNDVLVASIQNADDVMWAERVSGQMHTIETSTVPFNIIGISYE